MTACMLVPLDCAEHAGAVRSVGALEAFPEHLGGPDVGRGRRVVYAMAEHRDVPETALNEVWLVEHVLERVKPGTRVLVEQEGTWREARA